MITLEKPILSALLINATHDIDMGEGRIARMAFRAADKAYMRRPDGTVTTGTWQMLDDGYAVKWISGPSARWRLSIQPGRIAYVDPEGVERGVVTAISFGKTDASPDWIAQD